MEGTGRKLVSESDAPRHRDELIGSVCESSRYLLVARTFLPEWRSYFAATLSQGTAWKRTLNTAIGLDSWSWSWSDLASVLRCFGTKDTELFYQNMNRRSQAIRYLPVSPLLKRCIELKIANVSDESVIEDMKLAERYCIGALEERCLEYLLKKLPDMLRTQCFRRKMDVQLLQKLLHHRELNVRNEDEVLSLIDIWCSSKKRRSQRVRLLHEVRFAHLTENAFNKCRQDAQCLEVPHFRVLSEATRWSDLDDRFLSGRNYSDAHLHFLGYRNPPTWPYSEMGYSDGHPSSDGNFVYCSESGTHRSARGVFSETSVQAILEPSSRVSRKGFYVFSYDEPFSASAHPISAIEIYSDFRDSEPSSITVLEKRVFPLAPPVVFEDEVYIIHKSLRGQSIPHRRQFKGEEYEYFDDLEVLRHRDGKATAQRLRKLMSPETWEWIRCLNFFTMTTRLVVNKAWMIWCFPWEGFLLVIDRRNAVELTMEMPEKSWLSEAQLRWWYAHYFEAMIIENVAYFIYRYSLGKEFRDVVRESKKVANITAYDLTLRKPIPGHCLDLNPFFDAKLSTSDWFKLHLRSIEGEIFLTGLAFRAKLRESSFPILQYIAYRIRTSAGRLRMTLVKDGVPKTKIGEPKSFYDWKGVPINVDTYPCRHATMLQLEASKEADPIKREKLRRFIW